MNAVVVNIDGLENKISKKKIFVTYRKRINKMLIWIDECEIFFLKKKKYHEKNGVKNVDFFFE
jgi:hypothetical protein